MPKRSRRRRQPAAAQSGAGAASEIDEVAEIARAFFKDCATRTTDLEEQERFIDSCLQRIQDSEESTTLLDFLLILQFGAAPYNQAYKSALRVASEGNLRQSADMLWDVFKQASSWGQWAPARMEILFSYVNVLFNSEEREDGNLHFHILQQKDVRRLTTLFHNEDELTTIRMHVASMVSMFDASVRISGAEKLEISRAAYLLEPSQEECRRRVVFNIERRPPYSRPVLELLQMWKKKLQPIVEGELGKYNPNSRFLEVAPEDDAELYNRATRTGGLECDYCHATVDELGLTKLKLCGRCQNAFYCSAECQRLAWKQGHKQACRPEGFIVPGDYMTLLKLKRDPELNGRLIEVVEEDVDSTDHWVVRLLKPKPNQSPLPFSVKTSSLEHIRPAA